MTRDLIDWDADEDDCVEAITEEDIRASLQFVRGTLLAAAVTCAGWLIVAVAVVATVWAAVTGQ